MEKNIFLLIVLHTAAMAGQQQGISYLDMENKDDNKRQAMLPVL